MKDKVVLVTGGAGGVGRATAEELIRSGASVVVTDLPGKNAPHGAVKISADLSTVGGVREMTEDFLARYDRLDVLINNVGMIFPDRRENSDGLEMTFALNHLSYFATTMLLLEVLGKSLPAVVVNVSSSHHRAGRIDFEDLQGEQSYSMNRAYCQSKLANVLFTKELARRVADRGITTVAVHPGAIESGFGDSLRGFWRIMWKLSHPFRSPPEVAGRGIAGLLKSNEALSHNGGYFVLDDLEHESSRAKDGEVARRLWQVSLELSGLPNALPG